MGPNFQFCSFLFFQIQPDNYYDVRADESQRYQQIHELFESRDFVFHDH